MISCCTAGMWTTCLKYWKLSSTDVPPAASSLAPAKWIVARKKSGGADVWYPGRSLPQPELFVCLGGHATAGDGGRLAAACVRSAVPSYDQEMSTLAELLDEGYKRARGRTRKQAAGVRIL
jgi:hypothetical protein